MKRLETTLPDLALFELATFSDNRGTFMEAWRGARYVEHGVPGPFVQDNFSRSRKGVLRGLHYQLAHPQGKLVHVTHGAVYDVAVDIRVGSPTFGQHFGVELSADNHRQLWVPVGFAHGFAVLSDEAHFIYKVTGDYAPGDEYSLLWNDPALGIAWPDGERVLSPKDAAGLTLRELEAQGKLPRCQP